MAKQATSSTMFVFTEESVERRLPFKPVPALNNLSVGTLVDARIEKSISPKINEEDGSENTWEYAGIEVPSLVLTFKQSLEKGETKERFYEHRVKVITSVGKEGNEIEMKTLSALYTNMYNQLRHIGNAFKGLASYNNEIGTAPGLDPKASASVRAEQFEAFFQYWVDLFNGKDADKPMYKGVKLWIKLVADYSTKKFLTFPTYVGRGFIERMIPNTNPTIELEVQNGETIELKATEKGSKTASAIGGTSNQTSAGVETPAVDADIQNILNQYQ